MTVETIRTNDRPHINLATIARAERLALAGLGWNVDQVVRRALDLLEETHVETGRTFTRDEIAAALAGHHEDAHDRSPSDDRYLRALAKVLAPDPLSRRA